MRKIYTDGHINFSEKSGYSKIVIDGQDKELLAAEKENTKKETMKRICLRCGKETPDTPCPYCGGGIFKRKREK